MCSLDGLSVGGERCQAVDVTHGPLPIYIAYSLALDPTRPVDESKYQIRLLYRNAALHLTSNSVTSLLRLDLPRPLLVHSQSRTHRATYRF